MIITAIKIYGPWKLSIWQCFGLWSVATSMAFAISTCVWFGLELAERIYVNWKLNNIVIKEIDLTKGKENGE